jgi:hypothetical protein
MAVDVEYIIRLNDKLSSKLKTAQAQVDKLNNKVNKAKTNFGGLGSAFARVGGAVALGALAKQVVTLGVNMEQTRVSFTTFLGGTEEAAQGAERLIAQLNEFANVTPFTNDQVIKASRTLLAFGFTADELQPTLKMLGDVSAGTGKDLSELGVIFGQIKGAGRLMGQDLLQLINAGFNPLQVMSEKTGQSMSSLKDQMSKGAISFEMVQDAFKAATSEGGLFNDMMAKQSKTVGGQISTLIGKLQLLGIKVGEALLPVIEMFTKLATLLVENEELLKTLGVVVGIAAAAFVVYKVAALAATASTIGFSGAVLKLNAIIAANPIGAIVTAIAALVAIIVVIIRHYNKWGAAVSFLLGPLGMLINIVQAFRRNWEDVKKAFSEGGFLEGLKKIGAVLLDSLLMPIQQLLELVSRIPGLSGIAGKGAEKILALRERLGVRTAGEEAATTAEDSLTSKAGTGGAVSGGAVVGGGAGSGGALGAKVSEVKANAPKVFNINIEKLVEALNVNTTNLRDTSTRIKDEVEKALLTAITDASIISE